jgi:hypothetical protein
VRDDIRFEGHNRITESKRLRDLLANDKGNRVGSHVVASFLVVLVRSEE